MAPLAISLTVATYLIVLIGLPLATGGRDSVGKDQSAARLAIGVALLLLLSLAALSWWFAAHKVLLLAVVALAYFQTWLIVGPVSAVIASHPLRGALWKESVAAKSVHLLYLVGMSLVSLWAWRNALHFLSK